jgi:hypothetical protein
LKTLGWQTQGAQSSLLTSETRLLVARDVTLSLSTRRCSLEPWLWLVAVAVVVLLLPLSTFSSSVAVSDPNSAAASLSASLASGLLAVLAVHLRTQPFWQPIQISAFL